MAPIPTRTRVLPSAFEQFVPGRLTKGRKIRGSGRVGAAYPQQIARAQRSQGLAHAQNRQWADHAAGIDFADRFSLTMRIRTIAHGDTVAHHGQL